jgi:serine O-acetyltransferase
MFKNLQRDSARYAELGGWSGNLGFWVGASCRFGAWALRIPHPALRWPAKVVAALIRLPILLFLNTDIPVETRIGPGLCLPHPFNIVMGGGAEIGEDCTIFHEVTLGRGALPGEPKIGDNVVLFVGARVLGGVVVGARSEVGANCVVTRSLPPYSLVVTASRAVPQTLLRTPAQSGNAVTPAEERTTL